MKKESVRREFISAHTAQLSCPDRRPCNERIKLNRAAAASGSAAAVGTMPACKRLALYARRLCSGTSDDVMSDVSVYRRRRQRGHVTSGHVTYVSRETAPITNWIRYLRRRHYRYTKEAAIDTDMPLWIFCELAGRDVRASHCRDIPLS